MERFSESLLLTFVLDYDSNSLPKWTYPALWLERDVYIIIRELSVPCVQSSAEDSVGSERAMIFEVTSSLLNQYQSEMTIHVTEWFLPNPMDEGRFYWPVSLRILRIIRELCIPSTNLYGSFSFIHSIGICGISIIFQCRKCL